MQNLSKTLGLSKKKAYIFFTKLVPPIRRFQRFQAFSKNITEVLFMDLAFVDKLASRNKGIKHSLVAVEIFLRLIRVQTMKTKYATDTLQAVKKWFLEKKTPQKLWIDKGKL